MEEKDPQGTSAGADEAPGLEGTPVPSVLPEREGVETPSVSPFPTAGSLALAPVSLEERSRGTRLSRAEKNEARLFALNIVRDPVYRANLMIAARRRKLAP